MPRSGGRLRCSKGTISNVFYQPCSSSPGAQSRAAAPSILVYTSLCRRKKKKKYNQEELFFFWLGKFHFQRALVECAVTPEKGRLLFFPTPHTAEAQAATDLHPLVWKGCGVPVNVAGGASLLPKPVTTGSHYAYNPGCLSASLSLLALGLEPSTLQCHLLSLSSECPDSVIRS